MLNDEKVYASVDPKEAVSNMLVSSRLRIADSVTWCARKVGWDPLVKLDPVLARVILSPVSGFLASMDFFYNLVWLTANSGLIASRKAIRVVTSEKYGHYCADLDTDVLKSHAYKCSAFACAALAAPFAVLYSPERVMEFYKDREMIMGKENKGIVQAGLDKIKDNAAWTLDKISDTGEVVLRKVGDHKMVATLGAVAGAGAGLTFALRKLND